MVAAERKTEKSLTFGSLGTQGHLQLMHQIAVAYNLTQIHGAYISIFRSSRELLTIGSSSCRISSRVSADASAEGFSDALFGCELLGK